MNVPASHFVIFWSKEGILKISADFVSVPSRTTGQPFIHISSRVFFFFTISSVLASYLELTHVVIHSENASVKIRNAIRKKSSNRYHFHWDVINKLNTTLIIDFLVIWGNTSTSLEMNTPCAKTSFHFNVHELQKCHFFVDFTGVSIRHRCQVSKQKPWEAKMFIPNKIQWNIPFSPRVCVCVCLIAPPRKRNCSRNMSM